MKNVLIIWEILVISLVRSYDDSCDVYSLYSHIDCYSFITVLFCLKSVKLGLRYSICNMSCSIAICLKQIPTAVLSMSRDLAQATSPVSLFFPLLCGGFVCILIIMWLTVYKNLIRLVKSKCFISDFKGIDVLSLYFLTFAVWVSWFNIFKAFP